MLKIIFIISLIGVISLSLTIYSLVILGYQELVKKMEDSCKFYLISKEGFVSCKSIPKISNENSSSCDDTFFKDNQFWIQAVERNRKRLLKSELNLDKEFLEKCFD